ncbi:MAG: 2-polyprenyl-3-methyl-5-hydroxy-6-metoxy-1,4-benzoquinol methylase [Planctomycetota bacterium]
MSPIPGLADSVPEDALLTVPCGLCGSEAFDLKFKDGLFSVVTCRDCDLTYVTPRLTNSDLIEHVYNEGYWSSDAAKTRGYTDYRSDAELYLRTYRKRLAIVKRHFKKPGRVLDVGCAAGYFLKVMQDEGWDVTGLEPSGPIRKQAGDRIGMSNVIAGLLGEVDLEPGSYDLITLWDVLEHIPDPVAALALARELLAPGGKLLIETQNVDSRAAAVLGPKWQHYKHTEHIYHFNPDTLGDILKRAGLRVLENTPKLGGKYVSLGFISERAGRLHPILSRLLSPLRLVSGWAIYVNLFDEMIVVTEPVSDSAPAN